MSNILLVTSSPRENSFSTKVANALVKKLASRQASTTVTRRDLTHEHFAPY